MRTENVALDRDYQEEERMTVPTSASSASASTPRASLPLKKRGHCLATSPSTRNVSVLQGLGTCTRGRRRASAPKADITGENYNDSFNPVRVSSQKVLEPSATSPGDSPSEVVPVKSKSKCRLRSAGKTGGTAKAKAIPVRRGRGRPRKHFPDGDKAAVTRNKIGRWGLNEQKAFLQGLKKYGRGKWSKISKDIPSRDTTQVKTHAQVILKRLKNGENVYKLLDSHDSPPHEKKKKVIRVTRDRDYISDSDSDSHSNAETSSSAYTCSDDSSCTKSFLDSEHDSGSHSPTTTTVQNDGNDSLTALSPIRLESICFPENLDAYHRTNYENQSTGRNMLIPNMHTPRYIPPVRLASSLHTNLYPYDSTPFQPPISNLYNYTPTVCPVNATTPAAKTIEDSIATPTAIANNFASTPNTATTIDVCNTYANNTATANTKGTSAFARTPNENIKYSLNTSPEEIDDEVSSVAKILVGMTSPPITYAPTECHTTNTGIDSHPYHATCYRCSAATADEVSV